MNHDVVEKVMENLQNIVESLFLWEWKQKHSINILKFSVSSR